MQGSKPSSQSDRNETLVSSVEDSIGTPDREVIQPDEESYEKDTSLPG